jgi:4-hydroxybenzoate polyprenyltransferase
MIKWEHSIFALPFALTAAILAAGGLPAWRTIAWILVAMVAARSCAMAFNRWADADLDAANPRTRTRAIPAGLLTRRFVLGFTVLAALVFVLASAQLNRLTLYLSPLVLVVLLGYSYMKRISRWSHLVLGLALGLAPAAAWIAVRGSLDPRILVLTAAVTLWTLRLPGLRARPRRRTLQPAPVHRHSRRFLGRPRHASGHARPARLVRLTVSFSYSRLDRNCRRWPAPGL